MLQIYIFAGVLALGIAFLIFGPQGWRTVILHAAVVGLGFFGSLLDLLGAFDWRSLFDPATAAAIMLAISVLGLIYRYFTNAPVGAQNPPSAKSA